MGFLVSLFPLFVLFCLFGIGAPVPVSYPCAFQASGGYYYDLSPIRTEKDYEKDDFLVNICQSTHCGSFNDATVCLVKKDEFTSYGSAYQTTIQQSVQAPHRGVTIVSTGGTVTSRCPNGMESRIFISCNEAVEVGELLLTSHSHCVAEMYMESRHACPNGRLLTWEQGGGFQITILVFALTIITMLATIAVMIFFVLRKTYVKF